MDSVSKRCLRLGYVGNLQLTIKNTYIKKKNYFFIKKAQAVNIEKITYKISEKLLIFIKPYIPKNISGKKITMNFSILLTTILTPFVIL